MAHFGTSSGVFAASWGVLGRSWAPLGGLLHGLGKVLGRVDGSCWVNKKGKENGRRPNVNFLLHLGRQEGAKTNPRRPKIDFEIVVKNDGLLIWGTKLSFFQLTVLSKVSKK